MTNADTVPRLAAALRALVACGVAALCCADAQAQQREFFNGGFEANNPRGPGNPTFETYRNGAVPEWTDQTGFIELWDSGFQGVQAFEGNVFAEMNSIAPGTLYQRVCLVAGETIGWRFAHRARSGGSAANPQVALLEIADTSGTVVQSLASQTSFQGGPWNLNTGTTVYTGATGTQRVQFRTTNSGSVGNFVDSMTLDIAAFAQLDGGTGADLESSGGNIPSITVNGRVEAATTIPVSVSGGTADGDDYTLTAPAVTIPVGLYKNVAFALPLVIAEDNAGEADETLEITLGTPSTNEIVFARVACDGAAPQTTLVYTILNDDARLQGSKRVAAVTGPGAPSHSVPGGEMLYTIRVENIGTLAVDGDTVFLVDPLPPELEMFTGDLGGAGSGPVAFSQTGTGLSFGAANVSYSDALAAPSSPAACDYVPGAPYDGQVRHLCLSVDGEFSSGTPDPAFEVSFRMRIP